MSLFFFSSCSGFCVSSQMPETHSCKIIEKKKSTNLQQTALLARWSHCWIALLIPQIGNWQEKKTTQKKTPTQEHTLSRWRKHLCWECGHISEVANKTRRNADWRWEGKCFTAPFPFRYQLRRHEVGVEKRNALVRGNIWLPSPSVFPACGRPISSERSGLWQGSLVTAAGSCNTAGAFHISAVNKGNRSRSFSISTAHELPTCRQRLKGKRRESRPAPSWSHAAGWPVTSFSNSQPEKGRNGERRQEEAL